MEELNLNIEDLTFGQLEFLTDYTKRSYQEMMEAFASEQFTGRDLIAVLALATNPEDPYAGLEKVRNTKASEVDLNFAKKN